jgi:fatty-acyl-CoA synthase
VKFWAGGAPPPPALIKRFKNEIGITCETVYGLTEVYGPVTRFKPDADWSAGTGTNVAEGLSVSDTQGAEREREEREDALLDRCTYQVGDSTLEDVRVMDPVTMTEVPVDGRTLGEVSNEERLPVATT